MPLRIRFRKVSHGALLLLPSFATLSQFIIGNVSVPFTKTDNRRPLFIDNLGFGIRRLDQHICAVDAIAAVGVQIVYARLLASPVMNLSVPFVMLV
jgi:hypothetical protein